MPQKFEDSMVFPLLLQAFGGPYSNVVRWRKRSGKNDIQHQRTCPVCGSKLVNLYRRGEEWRCRKCWEKGEQDGNMV